MQPTGISHTLSLVSWNVTCRCNLRCAHCYNQAGENHNHQELSGDEGLQLIGQIAELSPGAMLILSGGEPLLRPDIIPLAEYASLLGLVVVLGTNGTLLDVSLARELKERGVRAVGISLDSPEPSYHDSFRGVSGAWQAAMRAIEACRRCNLEFQVHTTLTQGNYHDLPKMIELAPELGARAFNLFFLVCTGRGQKMTDIVPQQYEEALSLLAERRGCYQSMMVRARCAPHFLRVVRQQGAKDDGQAYLAGCLAATHYCRITCQGEVTPCPYLPLVAGGLRIRSGSGLRQLALREIWQSAALLRELRALHVGGKCRACDFRDLCQGCRARAYATRGSLREEDPWCVYQPAVADPPLSAGEAATPAWTIEARRRMEGVPPFVRPMVSSLVERYAQREGVAFITVDVLEEVKRRFRSQGASNNGNRA